jgi:putative membrane protein
MFATPTALRERVLLFLKGMAMGVADSVPGVSGGTIAVISGIYEALINALKQCHPLALKTLWQQGPRAFWQQIHGSFLLTLLSGILLSLVLMANTVLYLLDQHFVLVMAFFMGLVLASCWLLRAEAGRWSVFKVLLFAIGFVLTALTAVLNPMAGSTALPYIFISGMIAICAMILPGISGAFLLLLLGVYEYVLGALRNAEVDVILVFGLGCAIGLLSFAHLLSWTFRHYREQSYAFIIGMLAASLIVLWPWREATVPAADTGTVLAAVLCALLGSAVILGFSRLARG